MSSTADQLDLLTAGLAEDDRHTAHQAAGLPDEHGDHNVSDGGGPR